MKRALRAHGPEGYVCRARKQTGGYGRQGRLWTSPEGGLYQSILLRPTRDISTLPSLGFVMALSIRAALLRLSTMPPDSIKVKWPNDLMVGDKKIAGISMEATAGGVCIGVGVNVFRPKTDEELLTDVKYEPAFFADLAIGFTEVGGIAFGNGYEFPTSRRPSTPWATRCSRPSGSATRCGRPTALTPSSRNTSSAATCRASACACSC
ncbi:MAG: biotin--[Eggerthellaceae bacterium]|nr:biotin--[acetyl-CoA-carboxylase] ligase [Eggerthellaceae bacterium]